MDGQNIYNHTQKCHHIKAKDKEVEEQQVVRQMDRQNKGERKRV